MPCYDPYQSVQVMKSENEEWLEAALCMFMRAIENDTIISNDSYERNVIEYLEHKNYFRESGITKKSLFLWWREHYEKDQKRKEEIKANALAKLTDEEKIVLGLL